MDSLYTPMQEAHRLFLLEVGCSPESVLAEAAEKTGRSAKRASLFNQHDLTTPEGLRKILHIVQSERPLNVWISTECGPFSPIQNLNQRTEQQKKDLENKQREARKQHIGGLVVAYYARQQGSHVHWEWSRKCRAWKWDLIGRWRHREKTSTCIVGGCRVGLQDPKTGGKLGKEWRIETTCARFAECMHLPCLGSACEGLHVQCQGSLTRQSAFYTKQFASRAVRYMSQNPPEEVSNHPWMQTCHCKEFRHKGIVQVCSRCILGPHGFGLVAVGEAQGSGKAQGQVPQGKGLSEEEQAKWLHRIHLLHTATGHGSNEQLRRTFVTNKWIPELLNWLINIGALCVRNVRGQRHVEWRLWKVIHHGGNP